MSASPDTPSISRRRPAAAIPVTGPVAFMHPDDIGKVYVPASRRERVRVLPDYNQGEDDVDKLKVLLVTQTTVMMEASRPKGAKDRAPFMAAVQKYYKDGRLPDDNPLPWPKEIYDRLQAIK